MRHSADDSPESQCRPQLACIHKLVVVTKGVLNGGNGILLTSDVAFRTMSFASHARYFGCLITDRLQSTLHFREP